MSNPIRRMLSGLLFVWLIFAVVDGSILPIHSSAASTSHPQAVIPACDPITTDTIWSSGVYTAAECEIVVPTGVTLTIQAGVVMKLGSVHPRTYFPAGSTALIVDGTLIVQGTAAQPVIFTSLKDDTYVGDTNEDGDSVGTAGDWYGLVFRSGSVGQLEHFFVGYAGSGAANRFTGYNRAQIDVVNAEVQLRNGTVNAGLRKGIYLEGAGLEPIIENLHIADNNDPAWNSPGYAIYQSTINMQPDYSNLTFSGNDRDEVIIGRFNEAMTQDVVLGGTDYGFDCGYSLCLLTVPNSTTLTIEPGTSLDFRPSFGIAVADGGSLLAEGTPIQPITFTSRLAQAAAGASGHWMGLWAQQGSSLHLDQCDISYASDGNFGMGGLEINTDDAVVSNCRIHHNAHNGLYLYSRNASTMHPMLDNVDVTDNGQTGVYLNASNASSLSVTWDGGSISRNGWSGLEDATGNSTINPTLRNLIINGNGWQNNPYGLRQQGIAFDNHNVNPVLENITLTDNVGAAVHWYCNGSITAKDLTANGNGADELIIPGCPVGGGRQWNLGDVGIPVRVNGSIEVTPNALLSLSPGTTLGFDKNGYGSPTYLSVKDQGALYALGTVEKPIVFTGATTETGWWGGIEVVDRATVTLNHCEIAYGGAISGNNLSAILQIRSGLSGGAPANIQNCEIHHSGKKGVHFNFYNNPTAPVIFQNNSIHDTAQEGVANWNAPVLDARHNYWGNASGPYHPTQNPSGLGDDVGDNILFYPWLGAPDTGQTAPGAMLVSTGAPNLVSPGETVDYAIQYLNGMTETLSSSILVLQLPEASYFVESTGGGLYWPDRHQIVWKLGNLAPGANGFVSVRLRFQWGLAADYADGSLTQFAAQNYNAAALDVAEYNAYESTHLTVAAVTELSAGEFATMRVANPNLESLYQAALSEGFQYMSAARVTYADGTTVVVNAALRTPDRKYGRILSLSDGKVLASTVGGGKLDLQDTTGGMSADLNSQIYEFWGSWAPDELNRTGATCTEDRCFYSCMIKAKSWGAVARKLAGAVSWVIPPIGAVWSSYEVYDEITTYQQCKEDCKRDPTTHCCTPGETRWSPTGLKQQCAQYSCDAVGTWKQAPNVIEKCDFGQRCIAGKGSSGGCKECEEDLIAARFTPIRLRTGDDLCAVTGNTLCRDLTVRRAKDPNDITGLSGDLLPGQTVTYTIRYENEGVGRAYGVYVVNPLPAVFDESTLTFVHKSGVYLPESREIAWLVGELGPKGASDSEGVITYTVALTGGLPSGTIVPNQAVVYFPSVPEETPTNTWVNLISPLVATPQTLSTNYMTPLAIVLSGKDASSLPLTFEIVEQPHGGVLTGSAPNLTYTPAENFTGPDSFSFRMGNGTSTSRAAQVRIDVTPAGDTTPPTVLWTIPAADATGVAVSTTPVFTDTVGPVYGPAILIGMSEALDPSTVTISAVTLARSGAAVASSVTFDAGSNQIILRPRAALTEGEYTVTVSTGVKDLAGNGLASPYVLRFTVGEESEQRIYLPAVQK